MSDSTVTAPWEQAADVATRGNGQPETLPGLLPHHAKRLQEESGLSPETIAAAGIYSEAAPVKLGTLLNRRQYPKKCAPALVIPYRHADGREMGYHRVRPDNPRMQLRRPVKYESEPGRAPEPYFPPLVAVVIANLAALLLITEGEIKALCATQHGFPCIGLGGVFSWKNGKTERLLPALEAVGWKGRPVLIVFDSDATDNEMIVDAERRLAAQLTNLGAKVGVVRIPPGEVQDDGTHAKVGIDDYIVKHGAAAFQKLLDGAEEPTAPDPATMKIKACELDPATEAKAILGQDKADNVIRLRFWRGTFWYWKNGGYREMASAEARGGVVRSLNAVSHHLGARVVGDVLEQLRALSMLSYDVEPPAWLGKPPRDWEPIDVLATKTGLVHLPTLVSGGEYLHKPTPRYFSPAALSYGFDIKATAPVAWLAFLESLWPDDPESIATLQEWFGYCLTPDTSHQKILMLIGPKRSGKGTIARVLGGLIGTGNVCGPTLASLATNFGLWPLLGKTAAIVSDARLGGRTDAYVVVERLLSISGEDSLTIDRKNLEPVTVKLLTRLMLLSNELPRLIDQSGALASRMILLGLNQSFYGREDRGLTARLLTELPGILLWSVEGWRRLRDRGYFEQPSSGNELLGELNDLTSPVGEFVAECCEVGPALSVSRRDLFDAYANWAKEHGRSHIEDHAGFGRALRAAVSAVRTARLRADGGRQRTYVGIGLRLNTTAWG